MSQFRGTITGSRGKTTSRLGHKTTGLVTTCTGWNVGGTCKADYDEKLGKDVIDVYHTSGSQPTSSPTLIMSVTPYTEEVA